MITRQVCGSPWVALVLALATGLTALPEALQAKDSLTLRVNDAIGAPGGRVAVVLRTYASRPVGQGQVCFTAGTVQVGNQGPFAELESYKVFSKRKDAISVAVMEQGAGSQTVVLQFSSDSATINRVDGPLAVLYFRLRDSLAPGQKFRIKVDVGQSLLIGPNGEAIPIEGRAGDLKVRSAMDPFRVEAEGDRLVPGEIAELGLQTFEPFAIRRGRIALRYDDSVSNAPPRIRMDKRYGRRKFAVDTSTPGLVVVDFESRNSSLNTLPGLILSVEVPTSPGTRVGNRSRVVIDSSLTYLEGPEGDLLPLKFKRGLLKFEAAD